MYSIKCINDSAEYPLLELSEQDLAITEGEVEETINATATFIFSLPATNLNYDKVKKLESEIVVVDLDGDVEIFRGRCLEEESDFYNTKTCTCEGGMAYLKDSKHAPYLWQGSIRGFLEELINSHNAKAADKQKVYLGQVTVEDPNNYFRREDQGYDYTLKIIQDKIVDTYSGLLRVRRTNGRNYLDYLADYPESDQVIRFGENLLDITKYTKAEEVRTVIIPLGAEINEETGERLKIGKINGGKDYLLDQAMFEKYGWIEDTVEFDDVTLAENLKIKGQKYLEDCKNMSLTIELSAVDGRLLGLDVGRVRPGMLVRVISEPHGIDTQFLCTSKTTNLLSPDQDKITLGNQFITYTESVDRIQKEYEETVQKNKTTMMAIIKKAQDDFKEALENAKGLYHTVVKDEAGADIHYLHDKKNLIDSDIRIVVNTAGIGLTADAGQHWYGFQVDGTMIANILDTIGVNASWIRTGVLNADLITSGTINADLIKSGAINADLIKSGNINADLITVGVLTAALIKAGRLMDKSEASYWDLETGEMNLSGIFRNVDSLGNGIEIVNNQIRLLLKNEQVGYVYVSAGNTGQKTMGIACTDASAKMDFLFSAGSGMLKSMITIDNPNGPPVIAGGKTGKALFSDGSYLTFSSGILTGGKTANGTTF